MLSKNHPKIPKMVLLGQFFLNTFIVWVQFLKLDLMDMFIGKHSLRGFQILYFLTFVSSLLLGKMKVGSYLKLEPCDCVGWTLSYYVASM